MSKIRKLIGFALALAFAMAMLPAMAFAETAQYNLFVNGEQFTSEKLTIECGEGTATYDPATHTLTLNKQRIYHKRGRLRWHRFEIDGRFEHRASGRESHYL